ncbi:SH2 domain-containing protein A-like isoform X2 [Dioscorea cayenensis subsp. rotundata]|uniref:SH2 domain-containing protein A-like isoform X2 n=1 Tax=Dioscorea cayennensis subsp. rotundata TaxID=55577 RepID=A0AB40ARH8_DIOCR|nr:SH2 domain-containing protein A-like isoform X2 [Dioscorea cayenensis subsp. rotundata]
MGDDECRVEDYSELKDLRLVLDQEAINLENGFALCFWIYFSGSTRPSSLILRQVMCFGREGEAPFLALSEENKLMAFPLMVLHKEGPPTENSFPWTDLVQISSETECPLQKWVHIGCKITADYMHLYIDGNLVGEKLLYPLMKDGHDQDDLKKISLSGNDGNDEKLQGYVYNVQVLPVSSSIVDHFMKNPPVKLSIDGMCPHDEVEEARDGVWSIVGGKASCRRNFSLEVVLLDALGRSVHKEMEVVASLVYSDNGELVERSGDGAEAPLLTSFDGTELPSTERPVMIRHGRATFKLKISQLSSKSDNRLFRVCFHTTHIQRYPFLEAFSQPIRCISRNRSKCSSEKFLKKLASAQLDETDSPTYNSFEADENCEVYFQNLDQSESKCIPSSKRIKAGQDNLPSMICGDGTSEGVKQRNSRIEVQLQNDDGSDVTPSDSESTDTGNSESRWAEHSTNPITDAVIFKYCLEGTEERSILLKGIISSASNQDVANFAEQVCLYTGCSHHRHQIMISKELILQGSETWTLISKKNGCVFWSDAAPEINRKFMSIARSPSRGLSTQDLEVLREIAGCGNELSKDDFEKMWCWLYPVAWALSKDQLNGMWKCMSPKWIEGLITREEAEDSLRVPSGLQKTGMFILRFPTSRSWPHSDSGSLVVTYVGADYSIHHRLLSLDHSNREMDSGLLQELLLQEQELSQLGRVFRRN